MQRFIWVAVLTDETVLTEFNSDGTENLYRDIPREKVKLFGFQSPSESYIFDVKLGALQVLRTNGRNGYNIEIPLGKKNFKLTGPKPGNALYNFFQYKEANASNKEGIESGEPAKLTSKITRFVAGWQEYKILPSLGQKFVVASVVIDAETYTALLRVDVKNKPDAPPIPGCTYSIQL